MASGRPSRGADAVRHALNVAYGVQESRPLWKTELLVWGATVTGALLVLVAASALIAGGGVGPWIAGKLGIRTGFVSVMRWLRWPVLGATFMAATGLAYRILPDVKQRLRSIAPGAAAGALAWVLATWGFGHYVAAFGDYDVTYGSLGGVVSLDLAVPLGVHHRRRGRAQRRHRTGVGDVTLDVRPDTAGDFDALHPPTLCPNSSSAWSASASALVRWTRPSMWFGGA